MVQIHFHIQNLVCSVLIVSYTGGTFSLESCNSLIVLVFEYEVDVTNESLEIESR